MSGAVLPQSALTRENPHLWRRAVTLATGLTGYQYPAKVPLADGTITACGAGMPDSTIDQCDWSIKRLGEIIEWWKKFGNQDIAPSRIAEAENDVAAMKKRRQELTDEQAMPVPEGAMEWLLHEVGHWVVATPEERTLQNYGYGQEAKGVGREREWQAWAFEEIILGPFGHSRDFAAPSYRGGVAFAKNVPIPAEHLRHAERQTRAAGIDLAEWRALYGEWIAHELQRGTPSWKRPN